MAHANGRSTTSKTTDITNGNILPSFGCLQFFRRTKTAHPWAQLESDMAKTLCKHCKAINPAEAPTCHNCGERKKQRPSDVAACSALAPMSFASALESLPKKELIRLLTAVGQPPRTSRDRERTLLASRLSRYADKIFLVIEWDSRMPNVTMRNGQEPSSTQPTTTEVPCNCIQPSTPQQP
jgi:hypothetical protein